MTTKLPETWENARDSVMIGFNFVSDWLRRSPEFSGPIKERSIAKAKQSRIPFDAQDR